MKKEFTSIKVNLKATSKELSEFKDLLDSKPEFAEMQDLLPFFQARKQLIASLGTFHDFPTNIDKIAWEYDIFGDYKADFVVGDITNEKYCFIEFQDAKVNSIFSKTKRYNSKWADSFEEGFSQVIDWACKISDNEKSDDFDNRFQSRTIVPQFVIVVGRSNFLSESELKRFKWRRHHIVLNNRPIRCMTYDELYTSVWTYLNVLIPAAKIDLNP